MLTAGIRERHTARRRRRLAGVAVSVPPNDRVHDAPVLERHHIHRPAGVLTAIAEEQIGVFAHAPNRDRRGPQQIDVAFGLARSDRAGVLGHVRDVPRERPTPFGYRRWAGTERLLLLRGHAGTRRIERRPSRSWRG